MTLDIIETISDANGIYGNAAFVSLVPEPIVHKYESASRQIAVPSFGGLTAGTVNVIAPANVRYRQWLEAIAARTPGLVLGQKRARARRLVFANDERVKATFKVVGIETPLLDATFSPGAGLVMQAHDGGVIGIDTAFRWAMTVEDFIRECVAWDNEPTA